MTTTYIIDKDKLKLSQELKQFIQSLPEQQQVFLDKFPIFWSVRGTCKAIGIDPHTFYSWLRDSEELNYAFQRIKTEAVNARIQLYEDNIDSIAFDPEDDCTKQAADIIIEEKDLSKIIPYIKEYI